MTAPLHHPAPSTVIRFTVYGRPRPQGSKRHVGRGIMVEASKELKPWRQEITWTALSLGVPMIPAHVPLELTLRFYFQRAKSSKRKAMTTKPDSSKLLRAVEDSLVGILVYDDSQFIEHHMRKMYGGPERVEIEIRDGIV